MNDFQKEFKTRKHEIEEFLEFLKILEDKEKERDVDAEKSEFSKIFCYGRPRVKIPYQTLINTLKSNAVLMIYNITEYTVAEIIIEIYDAIIKDGLTYKNATDCIRSIWREAKFKEANQENAGFNTFLKKNEEILVYVMEGNFLEIEKKKTFPGGNLNYSSIKYLFQSHGMKMSSENFRSLNKANIIGILENFKIKRNYLAHGGESFANAISSASIDDIKKDEKLVIKFLEKLINIAAVYITNKGYKRVETR